MSKWSIPTEYNGIIYRSKLEADWAKFFEAHHMKFAYEPEGFNFGGVWYLPDFWLPEIKTIVEVKGLLDDTDKQKLSALAYHTAPLGIMVILAEAPAGENYKLVLPSPQMYALNWGEDSPNGPYPYTEDGPYEEQEEVYLSRCANCHRWYFRDDLQAWYCTACNFYDGDRTFDLVHYKISSNWGSDKCSDCGA